MSDLRERFRDLDQLQPPDLRVDIRGRSPAEPRPEFPWRQFGTAALALTVAAVGVAFVARAFQWQPSHPSAPSGPNARIAFMAQRTDEPDGIIRFDLCLVDPDGTQQECPVQGLPGYGDPAWSPDGSRLVFLRAPGKGDGDLFIVGADGSAAERVLEGWPGRETTWSPDGTRLAYYSQQDGAIHVMNLDGSQDHRISDSIATGDPAWSPDGSAIAFTARDKGGAIFVVRPDGSGLRQVTARPGSDFDAAWSPDGTRIAFIRTGDGDADVYTMRPDGTQIRRLTDDSALDEDPTWSPDGSKIAFAKRADVGEVPQLFVMNADGTGQRQLTQGPAGGAQPAWQPVDGSQTEPTEGSPSGCPIQVPYAIAEPIQDPSDIRLVLENRTPVVSALDGAVSEIATNEGSGWAGVTVSSATLNLTYRFYLDAARDHLPVEGAEILSGDVIGEANELLDLKAVATGDSPAPDLPGLLQDWGCREGLNPTDVLRARLLDGSVWEVQLAEPIEVAGAHEPGAYGELMIDGQVVSDAVRVGQRPELGRSFAPGFDPPVLLDEFTLFDGRRAEHWNLAPSHENETYAYALWVEGPGEHIYFSSSQPIPEAQLVAHSLRMVETDGRIDAIWFASDRLDVVRLQAVFFLKDPRAPLRDPEIRLNAACRVGNDPLANCDSAELEVPIYTPGTEVALRGATVTRFGS